MHFIIDNAKQPLKKYFQNFNKILQNIASSANKESNIISFSF